MIIVQTTILMEFLLVKKTFFVLRSRDFTTDDTSSPRLRDRRHNKTTITRSRTNFYDVFGLVLEEKIFEPGTSRMTHTGNVLIPAVGIELVE